MEEARVSGNCSDRVARWLRFFPVVLVAVIIACISTTMVSAFAVDMSRKSSRVVAIVVLVLFQVAFLNTCVNYLLCIAMDPGKVPFGWHALERVTPQTDEENVSELLNPRSLIVNDEGVAQGRQHAGRFCEWCKVWKPDRCHHCRSCERCVLKMDHHCVFINNCVGLRNQKFFILFVSNGLFGCAIATVFGFQSFLYIFKASSQNTEPLKVLGMPLAPVSVLGQVTIMGWFWSTTMTLTLAIFVGFHGYLLTTNQTTIETYTPPSSRPRYSRGVLHNIREVMGESPWEWFLPVRGSHDGVYDNIHYEQISRSER